MQPILRKDFFLLVAAIGTIGHASHSKEIDTFKVAAWSGGAYTNDTTGKFSHCVVYAEYAEGTNLQYMITASWQQSLGLFNSTWNIDKNQPYTASVSIDGSPPIQVKAVAYDAAGVRLELPGSEAILNKLKNGSNLVITTPARKFSFLLTDSSVAFERVRQCVSAHIAPPSSNPFAVQGNGATNPFSSNSPNTAPSQSPLSEQEVSGFAEYIFTSGLMPGFEVIRWADRPEALQTATVVWRHNGKIGWGRHVQPGATAEELLAGEFDFDTKKCTGNYASGIKADSVDSQYRVKRGFSMCSNGNSFAYSLYGFKDGTYLMFTSPYASDGKQTDDDQIFTAIKDADVVNKFDAVFSSRVLRVIQRGPIPLILMSLSSTTYYLL